MSSVYVLGPALDNVTEPEPVTIPATPGRRQIMFADPATAPGGRVNLKLVPPANPADALPINVYAFYLNPPSAVPPAEQRTPDWFFKSGAPNGSVHIGAADADGAFAVQVPGVKPGVYFVQTILEFQESA